MSQAYNWPHPGCVGLWRFENNGNDASGESNNGTASGGVAYALGKMAKCANLTADYYSLPYSASLKVSDLTVSAWYKSTSADNPGVLFATSGIHVGSSDYGYYGYRFETKAGKLSLRLMDVDVTGNMTINDGQWHFLLATRNNSVARVYVDGRINGSYSSPPSLTYCAHHPATYYYAGAYIGAAYRPMYAPSTIGYHPTCYLDELMIENYAIEDEEAYMRYLVMAGLA